MAPRASVVSFADALIGITDEAALLLLLMLYVKVTVLDSPTPIPGSFDRKTK
ncbi:hypothetical protein LY76DRAFT_596673 [Colletotrichum caudatum]|nr:hypothetical protein LY76DRAFT_596673 [Colletotrichum caudatum]